MVAFSAQNVASGVLCGLYGVICVRNPRIIIRRTSIVKRKEADMTYDLNRISRRLTLAEGKRNLMYPDTKGIPTIGVGHNLKTPISDAAVAQILADDIAVHVAELDQHLPWWRQLDPVRQEVMIELMFNMGWGAGLRGLSTFKLTLEAIRTGQFEKAASGLENSKWARDVKSRAGVVCEALEKGVWPERAM